MSQMFCFTSKSKRKHRLGRHERNFLYDSVTLNFTKTTKNTLNRQNNVANRQPSTYFELGIQHLYRHLYRYQPQEIQLREVADQLPSPDSILFHFLLLFHFCFCLSFSSSFCLSFSSWGVRGEFTLIFSKIAS